MSGMTTRQLIEEKLQDHTLGQQLFREVGGASSLAEIKTGRFTHRGVYVFPLRRSASPSSNEICLRQRVQSRYGIVLAAKNVRDHRGADAADEIEQLSVAVRSALLGYQPTSQHDPMTYVGGSHSVFTNDGHLLWVEVYSTAEQWRANS